MKSLLLVLTTLLVASRCEDLHAVRFKTVEGAYHECWRLLQLSSREIWQPCAPCENHCCAVLLRLWNDADSTVITPICPRFFKTNKDPQRFLSDAECCANRMLEQTSPKEKCRRTDGYYLCFNNSGIIQHERKYCLTATDLQQQLTISECSDILQIDSHELSQISRRGLLHDPRGRCLIRCFLIRQQLYSEVLGGVDEHRIFVQRGNVRDEEHFRHEVRRCVQRLERSCSTDRCTLAARIAAECLGHDLWSDIKASVEKVIADKHRSMY